MPSAARPWVIKVSCTRKGKRNDDLGIGMKTNKKSNKGIERSLKAHNGHPCALEKERVFPDKEKFEGKKRTKEKN